MSKIITLRKGLDINLVGKPQESLADAPQASEYALSPLDFEGVTPKLLVKEGDRVKAGTPLFFNKYNERVLFTSPVSGTVAAVNRGEKRKVLSVTVTPDASQEYEEFEKTDLGSTSREQIVSLLLRSGLWPMIVQRPYGIIADPSDTPKAVFISAFDSAPLAPDYNYVLRAEQKNLQTGIDVMRKLTSGKVHLSVRAKAEGQMTALKGAETHAFAGKHPVGNVGVQIHHIDPVNKGEVVWTVNIQDLAIIGRLFNEGRVDMTKIIAVAGSEIEKPQYCRIIAGAKVDSILKGNVKPQKEGDHVRIISGNVLTGAKTAADGFIGFYANQLTVIPEVRAAGLGDAPFQQILRIARLLLVALPQEGVQSRYQHERRRASVRGDGPLRAVSADGHLPDVPAQGVSRRRHRQDGKPRHLRSGRRGFRALRVRRSLEDRDSADHPRRY